MKAPSTKNIKLIPLDKLKTAPWNYKREDEQRAATLEASIRRHGQVQNMNVRRLSNGDYEVLDGNHRLIALRNLGAKSALCYDHGKISDASAKRLGVDINENRFDSDFVKLSQLLAELEDEVGYDDLAQTVPDIDDLMSTDWVDPVGGEANEGGSNKESVYNIIPDADKDLIKVLIGEIELRISKELYAEIGKCMKARFDAGDNYLVTIEAVFREGVKAVASGGTGHKPAEKGRRPRCKRSMAKVGTGKARGKARKSRKG